MKPLLSLLTVLLTLAGFQPPLFGWNESDHEDMTRLALEEVGEAWGLTRPVPIRPLQSLLDKLAPLRPELGDKWHWANYLKINPKTNLEALPADLAGRRTLTPLSILTLASVDPDDGRDQDLFVRDEKGNPRYAYPDQKWFGAMRGGNSQAFRHIEKPPFSMRHPLSTFGLPFRALGEATERAEIYFQASLLAFALGEDYWGWRLLGGALHYVEDLHQPYHAGQITPGFLVRGLWAYLSWGFWGHQKLGLMGTLSHLVANSHRFYESYVALPSGRDHGVKTEAFAALLGVDFQPLTVSVQQRTREVRDESNLSFPRLFCAVNRVMDPVLFSEYDFKSDGENTDDPSKFLKKDPSLDKTHQTIFEITRNQFESAGRALRSLIHHSIYSRDKADAASILKGLDRILLKKT